MQSERLTHCKKRGVFPIGQQYPRPLDPLAGSVRDCAIDFNFVVFASVRDNSIARRHAAISYNPSLKAPNRIHRLRRHMNPLLMTSFMESIV
jgi:hypothetical protein